MDKLADFADSSPQNRAHQIVLAASDNRLWWVDEETCAQLAKTPPADKAALDAHLNALIIPVVDTYAAQGVPQSPERDSVRYGMIVFADNTN